MTEFIPHSIDAPMPIAPDVFVDVLFADGYVSHNTTAGTFGPHTPCDDDMWSFPWRETDRIVGWRLSTDRTDP
jgi:hypothetical protein